MKAYVASGWFTPTQEKVRKEIIEIVKNVNMHIYSPKDDLLYVRGRTDPQAVFKENLDQIQSCDVVIASTEGKDMGTLFECGYAYSINKPIIYYWKGKGKFNLMLSQSAHYVVSDTMLLRHYLRLCIYSNSVKKMKYHGGIE